MLVSRIQQGLASYSEAMHFFDSLGAVLHYSMNMEHSLACSVTQRVDVTGTSTLEYMVTPQFSLDLNRWQSLPGIGGLSTEASYSAAQIAGLQALIDSGNFTAYRVWFNIRAQSFSALQIIERPAYSFFSFLSDLGGFISLVGLALSLLFPLTQNFSSARTFVLYYWSKQLCQQGRKQKSSFPNV